MQRRLGGNGGVEATRLHRAADVDDAAPFALTHCRQQSLGEQARGGEVECEGFLPHVLRRVRPGRTRAAGAIDQDVDGAQRLRGLGGDAGEIGGAGHIAGDGYYACAAFDLFETPRCGRDARALLSQESYDAGADAGAGTRHEAGSVLEVEFHRTLMDEPHDVANPGVTPAVTAGWRQPPSAPL